MAKVLGGGDSRISGMIGPVVYVNYNGKTYIRTAPRERAKGKWTPKQKTHRIRFREINAFWRQYTYSPIKQIWELAAEQMKGVNLFIKTNMPAFGLDGMLSDLDRLHFSAGKLPLPHKLKAERKLDDPEKVEVSWEDDSQNGLSLSNDELMMMVAHEGKFTGPIATGFLRKTEAAVIQLPADIGTAQGIYLFFANEKRKVYSGDQWFGI